MLPVAVQLTVKVDDAAAATVPIVELRPGPMSILGFTLRAQEVPIHINLAACLRISPLRDGTATSASAAELAFVVHNVSDALIVAVQRGIQPAAITGLAVGTQVVALNVDISAGLDV